MYINLWNSSSQCSQKNTPKEIKGDFQGLYTNRNISFSSNTTNAENKQLNTSKDVKK